MLPPSSPAHPAPTLTATAPERRDPAAETLAAAAFIERWRGVTASELASAQTFITELCGLLGVPAPDPAGDGSYTFEKPVTFRHGDGSTSAGRIDCYRRGAFVLEAKKLRGRASSFDGALLRARQQAEDYARALPAEEGRPPFVVVVDVGHVIELYAEFTRSGATYTPYPDARSHRIRLEQLADAALRERLRLLWLDPLALDPARLSARVTREVAAELAELARSLEAAGHRAETVAAFLTRCLFSMFAEDVGLLPEHATPPGALPSATGAPESAPEGAFTRLLRQYRTQGATLTQMLRVFWRAMDEGGFNAAIAAEVLRFNGKLFKGAAGDDYVLPLTPEQIDGLLRAAQANWQEVEPAIFGTLLERALDPTERHALGAHYTPRAYVERLVLPTVIEPLRADWAHAQAAALLLAREADTLDGKAREARLADARAEVRRFHHQLCTTRVLDPACGSGNFLYVTLEHLKRLEAEVLDTLEQLGDTQARLGLEGETVTVQQLRGIETNPRAAALAELVLWIGWLQWQVRTQGRSSVAEPVLHDWRNIEHRDALLAYDRIDYETDAHGQPRTRWDGVTTKPHPATGEPVPDETARVPIERYVNPRPATWPEADFILGNPPFIGDKAKRRALGDGYVDALRAAWPEVPESADFVMYWWHIAALAVREGRARRFGFITTNSLRQTFNRRVVEAHLKAAPNPLRLAFAIPDHPWVDAADGAAVRIAMTVGSLDAGEGLLQTVIAERETGEDALDVTLAAREGRIHADLTIGADVAGAVALAANARISSNGVMLAGSGFIVSPEDATALGLGQVPDLERHIRPYRNGRDLTDKPRGVMVIDLFGLTAEEVRSRYPAVFQWVFERVKPERDQNNRPKLKRDWWLFGEPRQGWRAMSANLHRYIATVETAKHRLFQFLDAAILPDHRLINFALDDGFFLGVLSSRVHALWAMRSGSWLGVGNDSVYAKTRCFETFPFPDADTGLTDALRERIRHRAEAIDAHRKRVLAAHAELTLTGLYNVLEALRAGQSLSPKEQAVHQAGLVSVLASLHDELDEAVLAAYGWSDLAAPLVGRPGATTPLPDKPPEQAAAEEELLARLVACNARRAAEEARGNIRWLRPDFQAPTAAPTEAASPTAALLNLEQESGNSRRASGVFSSKPADEATPNPAGDGAAHRPLAATSAPAPTPTPAAEPPLPWPASLPEQVRAVAEMLERAAAPVPISAIESRFKGRGPWKKSLPRILETLEALGRAERLATPTGECWRG
ncbi:type II restriction/modification system DNA methylase subunit YeeA [Tibeticola sediminis]|uniref:site-specific DNA-methyltransferase (adenine-specific) n=1 Tax=Tibeticola sediminis TaxID=1917811 RepID=A0A3N4UDB3_9BURK|nr:DNA methyltransferase [Tibeticola sediminis]RPE65079.1 type II restriction/modification system DNA methylase subunit YeeA [Tibeticola sediminis]